MSDYDDTYEYDRAGSPARSARSTRASDEAYAALSSYARSNYGSSGSDSSARRSSRSAQAYGSASRQGAQASSYGTDRSTTRSSRSYASSRQAGTSLRQSMDLPPAGSTRTRSAARGQASTTAGRGIGPIVATVAVLVVLAGLIVFGLSRCMGAQGGATSDSSSSAAAATASGQSSSAQAATGAGSADAAQSGDAPAASGEASGEAPEPVESPDGAQLQPEALNDIIGEDEAAKLLAQAETNADAYWIASHVEAFEFEGETVQWKILKLAADEPTSLKYVRDFADKYPADTADMDPALAMDESYLAGTIYDTGVPHLYQWDRRWGQIIYCSTTFGLTGCGPACMAMVYQGLTGNTDLSPYDMAVRAQNGGYMAQFDGTSTGFFFDEAYADGLYCEQIEISPYSIQQALNSGQLIIANLGEGYFTRFGHFFVLVGTDAAGNIIINDPYSEVRSTQTWDPDLIANESIALFAFGRAY